MSVSESIHPQVIGIGKFGCQMARSMASSGMTSVEFVEIEGETYIPRHVNVPASVLLSKLVFLIVTCGDEFDSKTCGAIADIVKGRGGLTIAIVYKPCVNNEKCSRTQEEPAAEFLRSRVDAVIEANQAPTTLGKVNLIFMPSKYTYFAYICREVVKGIVGSLDPSASLHLDYADLCDALRATGLITFGAGHGVGHDRLQMAIEMAVASHSPMFLSTAKTMIVSVSGGNIEPIESATITDRLVTELGFQGKVYSTSTANWSYTDQLNVCFYLCGHDIQMVVCGKHEKGTP